MMYNLFRL